MLSRESWREWKFRGNCQVMVAGLPVPTLRLYLAALALAAPLGLGIIAPLFVGVAVAAGIALLAAALADYAAAARPDQLRVERRHELRLYLGTDNRIDLAIGNDSRRAVVVSLRDTPPVAFASSALFLGPRAVAFQLIRR